MKTMETRMMPRTALAQLTRLLLILLLAASFPAGALGAEAAATPTYEELVAAGRKAMNEGRLAEAGAAALAAIRREEGRFEAYALAALVKQRQGATADALKFVERALEVAPEGKRALLEQLKAGVSAAPPAPVAAPAAGAPLSREDQRKWQALQLIHEEARQAPNRGEQQKLLWEFVARSAEFASDNPDFVPVWLARAGVCVELHYCLGGLLTVQALRRLKLDKSDDPEVVRLFSQFERKGWLNSSPFTKFFSPTVEPATVEQLESAADRGDLDAQSLLGDLFFFGSANYGLRAARDIPKGLKLLHRASEGGDSNAQVLLARAYDKGLGLPQNKERARWWALAAAKQGNVGGFIYLLPDSADEVRECNFRFSLGAHAFAAEKTAKFQHLVGRQYETGNGIPQNLTEAANWYSRSAGGGNLEGVEAWVKCLLLGRGVPRDLNAALKWAKTAVEIGDRKGDFVKGRLLVAACTEALGNAEGAAKVRAEMFDRLRVKATAGDKAKAAEAQNSMAWLMATHPDKRLRNGVEAVQWAKRATEYEPTPNNWDTLAAAHAEAGDFANAVSIQSKAISLLTNHAEIKDYELRLALYRERKAYREEGIVQPEKEGPAGQTAPPQSAEGFDNSLGMRFVPVPGTEVLFAVWHTRVQDFEVFVGETGYDATGGMFSLRSDGYKQRGDSWKSPGFPQSGQNPVCGVSWEDAQAFCKWLTERERKLGRIGLNKSYRLPKDWEWSVAVGLDEERTGSPISKSGKHPGIYPWGKAWPPPTEAGNFACEEARNGDWPASYKVIDGIRDGYSRTSPVGAYAANRFGLHDMAATCGNGVRTITTDQPEQGCYEAPRSSAAIQYACYHRYASQVRPAIVTTVWVFVACWT